MIRRTVQLAATAALAVLAAGCGGSEPAPGTAAPAGATGTSTTAPAGSGSDAGSDSGSGSGGAGRDACALATPADVAAAAGKPAGTSKLTLGAEQISICSFDGAEVQLSVTYSPRIGARELGSTRPPQATDVPGLGDRAYVYTLGSGVVKVTTLAVVTGDAGVLLVSNQLEAAALQKLAGTIVGRL